MKKLLFILLVFIATLVSAQSVSYKYNEYLHRYDIYQGYTQVGYITYNSLYDQVEIYDMSGKLIQKAQNNGLFDRTDTYNSSGTRTGYTQKNIVTEANDTYNANGEKEYSTKWNELHERYDVFDKFGTLIGYYQYNGISQSWEFHSL